MYMYIYTYIDKLGDIIKKHNNTHHNTSKMKAVDVKLNTCIDFGAENNDSDPKIGVGDHIKTSKYKNILTKVYTPNWSEVVFVIKIV